MRFSLAYCWYESFELEALELSRLCGHSFSDGTEDVSVCFVGTSPDDLPDSRCGRIGFGFGPTVATST